MGKERACFLIFISREKRCLEIEEREKRCFKIEAGRDREKRACGIVGCLVIDKIASDLGRALIN